MPQLSTAPFSTETLITLFGADRARRATSSSTALSLFLGTGTLPLTRQVRSRLDRTTAPSSIACGARRARTHHRTELVLTHRAGSTPGALQTRPAIRVTWI